MIGGIYVFTTYSKKKIKYINMLNFKKINLKNKDTETSLISINNKNIKKYIKSKKNIKNLIVGASLKYTICWNLLNIKKIYY